jgi:hypothetical protein
LYRLEYHSTKTITTNKKEVVMKNLIELQTRLNRDSRLREEFYRNPKENNIPINA